VDTYQQIKDLDASYCYHEEMLWDAVRHEEAETMVIDNVTLSSGMRSNLISVKKATDLINPTTSQLASGAKVASSVDDPLVLFMAREHLARASCLSIRKDEIREAIQTVRAAQNGTEAIMSLLEEAKSVAQSARTSKSTIEKNVLKEQFNEILYQIDILMADSGYRGVNLLGGTSQLLEIYFGENGDSKIIVSGFDSSAPGLGLSRIYQSAENINIVQSNNNFSVTGNFTRVDDVQLFSFSIDSDQSVTIRTLSCDGGTNAAGETIPSGGFYPVLSLYDSNGVLVEVNDDNGLDFDSSIRKKLTAGEYTVALTAYTYFPNGYPGPVSLYDGFSGALSFDLPASETGLAVDFINVNSIMADEFQQALKSIETAKFTLKTGMGTLSSSMSSILIRQDFTDTLAKPLQEGEGNPTPAGLNEEGANLLMLQIRQALGTLSMAFSSLETQGSLRILANTANAPMTGSEQAEAEEANVKKLWDFSL
jgi:flagellin